MNADATTGTRLKTAEQELQKNDANAKKMTLATSNKGEYMVDNKTKANPNATKKINAALHTAKDRRVLEEHKLEETAKMTVTTEQEETAQLTVPRTGNHSKGLYGGGEVCCII